MLRVRAHELSPADVEAFCELTAGDPQACRFSLRRSGRELTAMEAIVTRWNVDSVDFDVDTVWGLTIARGRFDRVAGSYEAGPEGTKIELKLDSRSVVTGNGIWDDLLHSTELSGLAEHPEVGFRSTRVLDSGQGKLHVEGVLQAAGKVVPLAFDAVLRGADHGLQLEVAATVHKEQLGKRGGQLGLILPAAVHVRARLTPLGPEVRPSR